MRQRIEIRGHLNRKAIDLNRKAIEALQLEIRRLGRCFGVKVTDLRIERVSSEEENGSV
jgi:hypothetical protein